MTNDATLPFLAKHPSYQKFASWFCRIVLASVRLRWGDGRPREVFRIPSFNGVNLLKMESSASLWIQGMFFKCKISFSIHFFKFWFLKI